MFGHRASPPRATATVTPSARAGGITIAWHTIGGRDSMDAEQHPPEPDYRAYAAAGASALQHWYRPSRGLWQGAGWWQSANALTAVIRYAQAAADPAHTAVVETTFRRAPRWRRGFCNKFFDDNAWWALAW